MDGINRTLRDQTINKAWRTLKSISYKEVPCIFISYQRKDEKYASDVADSITSKQLDVYFDLAGNDLKQLNQTENPLAVTDSIKAGLNKSDYMLVIVSPDTYRPLWVPFEVGYAYDKKGDKMKILRHKGISKTSLPAYLKVKEMSNETASLNRFLRSVRHENLLYEKIERAESKNL